MKITVLNGSPKGEFSGTLKYFEYLRLIRPELDVKVFHVAQRIHTIIGRDEEYRKILEEISTSDGVIWCFPLYYLLVHSGLKQFIELIFERKDAAVFQDKYSASLSTSIHFFDNTAHTYIEGIAEDLGMRFTESFSPHMHDFLKPEGRRQFEIFIDRFLACVREARPIARRTNPVSFLPIAYSAGQTLPVTDSGEKKVLIVADRLEEGKNITEMVRRFTSSIKGNVETVELRNLRISGSCQGCLKCGWDNTCAYEGKDDYIDFFRSKFMAADIIVLAGAIKDRFLSWEWKRFMDRNFWRTHSPAFTGQQIGLLVSGPLSQLQNIRDVFTGYFEVGRANLLGIVADECGRNELIDSQISALATGLVEASHAGYKKPVTFPGVGGQKIFRDDIFSDLKPIFRADYKFYKKNRLFDFPQKKIFMRVIGSILFFIMKLKTLRKGFTGKIKEGMVMPHDAVLRREKARLENKTRSAA